MPIVSLQFDRNVAGYLPGSEAHPVAAICVTSYYMPALLFSVLIGVWHFFRQWYLFDPVYQNIHENWYPNNEKIWLYALKFYAYVMVVILTIMGPSCRGDLFEKPCWSRPDRPTVLTEVVTDLKPLSWSHKKAVASLKTLQN